MNLRNGFGRLRRRARLMYDSTMWSRRVAEYDVDLSLTEAAARFPDPNTLYRFLHHYYRYKAPAELRRHREYFRTRGFGEDAFHAMWYLLFREVQPKVCLEIGVYRGQVITLWGLLGRMFGYEPAVYAVSPFSSAADGVSRYSQTIDYYEDVIANNAVFDLPAPHLVRALSTDAAASAFISSRAFDLAYIDGSHDFDVVLSDYRQCVRSLSPDGLLVLDDAARGSAYRPPAFAFAGHEGPSRVSRDFAQREQELIARAGHNHVFRKRREA